MIEAFTWLNNREISIVIWAVILLFIGLAHRKTREGIFDIVKIVVTSQIGTVLLLCIAFTMGVIVILQYIGYWEMSLTKEAVVWLFGFAFYSTFKVNEQKNKGSYFKEIIFNAIKITAFIEFATSVYVLGFIGELILVFVLSFLGLLIAYSEHMEKEDPKHSMTSKFLNNIFYIIVAYVIFRYVQSFISNPKELFTLLKLKEFTLPIILTFSFIPLLYTIAFYMFYESFSIRLFYMLKQDKELIRKAKWKLFLKSGFNIDKLVNFENKLRGKLISNTKQLNLILNE